MNNKDKKIIKKVGGGEIKKEAGKGLTFFKMFRAKQKEDKKGLTFGGFLRGVKRVGMIGFVVVNVLGLVLAPVGNVPVGGAEAV